MALSTSALAPNSGARAEFAEGRSAPAAAAIAPSTAIAPTAPGTVPAGPAHARSVASLACCAGRPTARSVGEARATWSVGDARAVAPRPVDARTVPARSVDARAIGPLAYSNSRSAPATPSDRAAPARAATPAKAALIPTRSAPTDVVPAITPTLPKELYRLHGSKFICCRPQGDGSNHGGMRGAADHCTHDRERGGQCQTDFAHWPLPCRADGPVRRQHRSSRPWPSNFRPASEVPFDHAQLNQGSNQKGAGLDRPVADVSKCQMRRTQHECFSSGLTSPSPRASPDHSQVNE